MGGGVTLDKVIYNGTTVFESVVHKTGQLYYPTSNTSLGSKFTISDWSSGSYGGDDSSACWRVFGDGYYCKKANVAGQYAGAQITFNTSAKIYPIKIYYYGGNQDAGGGGGGGSQECQARNASGTWYTIGTHSDIGGGTITMDGKTQITGLRMRTIYGSGPEKYLEVNDCQVTEWNQSGTL